MPIPFEKILVIDFETAWDKREYTLSKMTTEEYVRDPRFKAWGLCWKVVGEVGHPVWVRGKDIQQWANGIDWSRTAVLAHNAQFDVTILSWRFGVQPAFIFDTLSMARALRGVEVGNSLAKLAEEFELPPKGQGVYSTDGMLDEIPFEVEQELADYCRHDTFLCEEIFKRLSPGYPAKELRLIDMTLRMYTRPMLELDPDMLASAILEEREKREALLARLGATDAVLASNPQFAELLRAAGVEPPMKKSKTTGEMTYALAKNDAMFQALLAHKEEEVVLLCEARLKVKSTTERTRAQRFLDIANRGKLPVPLSYFGAITGRWTAAKGSAINMQNLKRGSFLRNAIMAPEGHQLIVADLSQIEPRVLAVFADYDALLDIFRAKGDPYAQFGAQIFNIPGLSKETHADLRQSAKSALLGANYGLGWASFASQLMVGFMGAKPVRYDKKFAKQLGVTGDYIERFLNWEDNLKRLKAIPHTCTEQELLLHCVAAKKVIDLYRAAAHPIVGFWEMCNSLIQRSLADGEEYRHKCLIFRKEEIVLPNGMSVRYPNLRQEKSADGGRSWVYGPDATKLYGGKITNNVVQGTARIVMTDGMLRIAKRYPVVGTVHDECIAVAPDAEAQDAYKWMLEQMTLEPSYLPGIPLAADGGYHRRYGMAKS